MRFDVLVSTSVGALRRNTLRSLLTALGVIIGVAAVTALVAIGQGASRRIQNEIAGLGTNLLLVFPGAAESGRSSQGGGSRTSLRPADAQAIEQECSLVAAVAPVVNTSASLIAEGQTWRGTVTGTTPGYTVVRNWPVEFGEMFADPDVRGAAKVAVLGRTVAGRLFPDDAQPVGRTLRIRGLTFRIVGVLMAKGPSGFGQDQDDVVLVPLSTAQKRLMGISHIQALYVSAVDEFSIPQARGDVAALLRERHRLRADQDDDFEIGSQLEIASVAGLVTNTLTLLLAGVAAISLLVGGIGIMNIMLVSVTERTREIGLRRALGARRSDVLSQFLTEAVLLSMTGGLLGLVLGVVGANLVAQALRWPPVLPLEAMVTAFVFSALVGVVFGYVPARRASQLSPIDALRHE